MASPKAKKVPVLGKTTKADVPADLFGEDFHQSLVHEAARADANSRRRGTASTLTRGEVAVVLDMARRDEPLSPGIGGATGGVDGDALLTALVALPQADDIVLSGQTTTGPVSVTVGGEALERCTAGIGDLVAVPLRGEVAQAQAAVVVGRTADE